MSATKDERRDRFVAFHEVAESGASRFIPLTHAVVILARADEFLLVLNRRTQAWELPGGLIDPGESPRDCATRELREETGLSVASLRWRGVTELDLQPGYRNPTRRVEFGALYVGELTGSVGDFESDEVQQVGMWRIDRLPLPLATLDATLLDWWIGEPATARPAP
jgi:8-oxo-dGTP pyrophosphatase MutT (NUDIX family)